MDVLNNFFEPDLDNIVSVSALNCFVARFEVMATLEPK